MRICVVGAKKCGFWAIKNGKMVKCEKFRLEVANLFYMFSEVPRECFCFSVEVWYEIDERSEERHCCEVHYDNLQCG